QKLVIVDIPKPLPQVDFAKKPEMGEQLAQPHIGRQCPYLLSTANAFFCESVISGLACAGERACPRRSTDPKSAPSGLGVNAIEQLIKMRERGNPPAGKNDSRRN